MLIKTHANVDEIIQFVCGVSTSYGRKYVSLYVFVFLEAPLQGGLRTDNGHMWNANDPQIGTFKEGPETWGESRLLHFGHGDLELQKMSDVVSRFFIFAGSIGNIFYFFWGASCELMTGKSISNVDDVPDEDTDATTNQNP